jgi:alkylation response protein AidB-like acyl-CoA dehydrogenase
MRYMFTMMNNARLSVGLEGLALASGPTRWRSSSPKERRQGRAPGAPAGESRRSSSTPTCAACCSP